MEDHLELNSLEIGTISKKKNTKDTILAWA